MFVYHVLVSRNEGFWVPGWVNCWPFWGHAWERPRRVQACDSSERHTCWVTKDAAVGICWVKHLVKSCTAKRAGKLLSLVNLFPNTFLKKQCLLLPPVRGSQKDLLLEDLVEGLSEDPFLCNYLWNHLANYQSQLSRKLERNPCLGTS